MGAQKAHSLRIGIVPDPIETRPSPHVTIPNLVGLGQFGIGVGIGGLEIFLGLGPQPHPLGTGA